jgi:hypothetical protein
MRTFHGLHPWSLGCSRFAAGGMYMLQIRGILGKVVFVDLDAVLAEFFSQFIFEGDFFVMHLLLFDVVIDHVFVSPTVSKGTISDGPSLKFGKFA